MFFDIGHLWPYVLIVFSLVASPGPDSVLIIRNTLGSGIFVGLSAVVGVQIGLGVHTLLAITGISLIIRSVEILFTVLIIVGSVYLCWLGLQAFIHRSGLIAIEEAQSSARHSFRDALMTNLFNPKAIILFLVVMPSFVVPTAAIQYELQLVVLALMLLFINTIWQTILVCGADYLGRKMMSESFSTLVNRVCGACLIFFGILLFIENTNVF